MFVMTRLFRSYLADFDQALHQGVVLGYLSKAALIAKIGAAITDPRDGGLGRQDKHADAGRAHTARLDIGVLVVEDLAIRVLQRILQELLDFVRLTALELFPDVIANGADRDRTSHLARLRAAHTVGDDEEEILRRFNKRVTLELDRHDRILIELADHPDIS